MDKDRDVRRGATRFSKQSGPNLVTGPVSRVKEKSKREKLRRLSAVVGKVNSSYEDCEMGCDVSNRDKQSADGTSYHQFKIPNRLSNNSNGVDHVSVPRKLRSAMKKRNRESLSPPLPDSKKRNHTITAFELPKKNILKKSSKLNMKQEVCGSITKDEEEVVETLSALAGMFPDNDENDKIKLAHENLEAKVSTFLEPMDVPRIALQDSDETNGVSLLPLSRNPKVAIQNSDVKLSTKETAKCLSFNDSPSRVNFQIMAPLENNEELHTSDTSGIKLPMQSDTSHFKRKAETPLVQVMDVDNQLEETHRSIHLKKNGTTLWPGLSSPAADPYRLNTSLCSVENSSDGKVFKCKTDRRSWKRCAAHVCISHLIQKFTVDEKNRDPSLPLQPNQSRLLDESKQGSFIAVENLNGGRGSFKEYPSTSSIYDSGAVKIPDVSANEHQNFDFLTLSARVGRVEGARSSSKSEITLEPMTQFQIPYQHANISQQHNLAFSLPHSRYSTMPYPDQKPSASATKPGPLMQMPSYFSNTFKEPQQLQIQQQQRLWAAHLAAQCRPSASASTARFPSLQNVRHDSSSPIPCTPQGQSTLIPSVPPSMEIPSIIKYASISHQQHQQFLAVNSSLPPSRLKRQDRVVPSVYEEAGAVFNANSQPPLQLLCHERY